MKEPVITLGWKRVIWRLAAVLCLAGALLVVARGLIVPRVVRAIGTRQIMAALNAPDEKARQQGAWRSATRPPGPATDFMAEALAQQREREPGVRESYVYALGRLRMESCLPLLLSIAREDSSGYVRQAAWVAAARVDFARFRQAVREFESAEAAREQETATDDWSRIGIAAAFMEGDDFSYLEYLLGVAAGGDDFQRNIAGAALQRYLRPLLRAAGQWPLEPGISAEGIWSAAFVEDIRRRAAALNLVQIAAYSRPEQQGTEALRRMMRRIYGARARVVRVLYSIEADE